MIKISLLKLCDKSVWKTLDIIYKTRLKLIKFPPQWKKSNVVPVHKESDKKLVNIIVLFHYYQFGGKCLKEYSIII